MTPPPPPDLPVPPGDPSALRDAAEKLYKVRQRLETARDDYQRALADNIWPFWHEGQALQAVKLAFDWVEAGGVGAIVRTGAVENAVRDWADSLEFTQKEADHLRLEVRNAYSWYHTSVLNGEDEPTAARQLENDYDGLKRVHGKLLTQLAEKSLDIRSHVLIPDIDHDRAELNGPERQQQLNAGGYETLNKPDDWSA